MLWLCLSAAVLRFVIASLKLHTCRSVDRAHTHTHTLTPRPALLCVCECVCACFVGFLIGQTLISLDCTWAKPRQQQRPNQPTAVAGLGQGIVIVIAIVMMIVMMIIVIIIIVIDWARQTAPAPAHIALRRHLHFPLYAHTQSPLYIHIYVAMPDILSIYTSSDRHFVRVREREGEISLALEKVVAVHSLS